MTDKVGPGHLPPWAIDALLAVAVTVVLSVLITASSADGGASPGASAYVFAAGFGAVLLLRRHWPVATLLLSVLGIVAYQALELPMIGVAAPVAVALFSVAEAGLMRWGMGAGSVVFGLSLYHRLRADPQPEQVGALFGHDPASTVALITAAISLGYGVRSRRVRCAQHGQIIRLTEEQLAREADLRSLVGILRQAGHEADIIDAAARQMRSLSDLGALIGQARAAGLRVITEIDVDPAEVSAVVDSAAYGVIRESLTNVIRHARADTVVVRAVLDDDRLHLTVSDDGRGAESARLSGHGIPGMSELVRLVGGELATAGAAGKGFTVHAVFPAVPTF